LPKVTSPARTEQGGKREVLLSSGWKTTPVFHRGELNLAFEEHGPIIIEDEGCTVFVPPGCEVSVTEKSCLRIWIGDG
jgi:N-methylhydantoinase A/oxoprolinase/acetone carboxylase beta subunit